jgi:hypothetical protein
VKLPDGCEAVPAQTTNLSGRRFDKSGARKRKTRTGMDTVLITAGTKWKEAKPVAHQGAVDDFLTADSNEDLGLVPIAPHHNQRLRIWQCIKFLEPSHCQDVEVTENEENSFLLKQQQWRW